MARAPIGLKIRKQRKANGMTQAVMAQRLDISASYLNLIEHNKRPIAGKLLIRISEELGIDVGSLDGAAEQRTILDLHELTIDPLLRELNLSQKTATELVGQHPQWANALVTLHRTYLDQQQSIIALSDRLNHEPFLTEAIHTMLTNATAIRASSEILGTEQNLSTEESDRFHTILADESSKLTDVADSLSSFLDKSEVQTRSLTPADEVDDFFMENSCYFADLEEATEDLRQRAKCKGVVPESILIEFLTQYYNITVKFGTFSHKQTDLTYHDCQYHQDTKTFEIPDYISPATRRYEIAWLIVELSLADAITAEMSKTKLLTSPAAQQRAARELLAYAIGAFLLPYDAFIEDAERSRYDVELLSRKYTLSFSHIANRLVTLRKPNAEGVPFALTHINAAGYVLKRVTLPRLPIPRYGNACTLWNIYSSFQAPERIVRQLAIFPDNEKFLFFAKTEAQEQTAFSPSVILRSTMLACSVNDANRTIYADGYDLSSSTIASPVGLNCRLCSRSNCSHREEAPIINQ